MIAPPPLVSGPLSSDSFTVPYVAHPDDAAGVRPASGSISSIRSTSSNSKVALSKYVSPPAPVAGSARGSTSSTYSASLLTDPNPVSSKTTFRLIVLSRGSQWSLLRTLDNICDFDSQLHSCVFDRKFTELQTLSVDSFENMTMKDAVAKLAYYFAKLTDIGFSMVTCALLLNWLELDNKGFHVGGPISSSIGEDINTPGIAAAHVTKSYLAEAADELSLQKGDIVSVIDMSSLSESAWWRGKKDYKVGFFPCHCVELIDGPKSLPASLQDSDLKPVFRKRGKVVSFFRVFFLSRPSRRELKKRGILRERVFGCDLAEHLQNVGEEVPVVIKACCSFIEKYGIVDGIYRLSGIVSNIQRLRNAFDENRVPDMTEERYLQDIHCVTSLLKMYLRELPNPLLTYQLYDDLADAVDGGESNLKILKLHDIIQRLPPPHYRTAEFLIRHLARIAEHSKRTNMHIQNLAIVWAPNLMRCKEHEGLSHLDSSGSVLHSVGVQAQVTEYLIRYHDMIFNAKMPPLLRSKASPRRTSAASRPQSMAVSTPAARMAVPGPDGRRLPDTARLKVIDLNANPIPQYHTIIEQRPGQKRKLKFGLFGGGANSGSGSISSVSSARVKRSSGSDDSTPGGSTRSMGWVTTIRRGKRTELPEESHGVFARASQQPQEPPLPGHRRSQLRSVRSAESLLAGDTMSSQSARKNASRMKSSLAQHHGVPAAPPPPSVTTAKHLKLSRGHGHHHHNHKERNRTERAPPPPPPPLIDTRRTPDRGLIKEYSPAAGHAFYSYDNKRKPLAIVNPCSTFTSAATNDPLRPKAGSVPPNKTPLATFDDEDWFYDPPPTKPLGSRKERREKGMSRSFDDTFLLADSSQLTQAKVRAETGAASRSLGADAESEPSHSLSLASSPPITAYSSAVIYETSLVSSAAGSSSSQEANIATGDSRLTAATGNQEDVAACNIDDSAERNILDSSMSSAGEQSPAQGLKRNAFSTPSLPTAVGESPDKWSTNRASYIHVESSGEEGDGQSLVSWSDISRPLDKISEASGSSLVEKQVDSARSMTDHATADFDETEETEGDAQISSASHVLSIAIEEATRTDSRHATSSQSSPLSLASASPAERRPPSSGRSSVSPRIKVDPKLERALARDKEAAARSLTPESPKLDADAPTLHSTPSPPYTFSMAHDLLQSMNSGGAQALGSSVPLELRKSVYDNLGSSPAQSPSRNVHPMAISSEVDLDDPVTTQCQTQSAEPHRLLQLREVKLPQPEVAVIQRMPAAPIGISKAQSFEQPALSSSTNFTSGLHTEEVYGFEEPLPLADSEPAVVAPPPIPPHQGRAGSAPPAETPKIPSKPAVPARTTPPLANVPLPPKPRASDDASSGAKRKNSRIADRLAVFESSQGLAEPPPITHVAELRMSGRMKSSPNFEPARKRTPPGAMHMEPLERSHETSDGDGVWEKPSASNGTDSKTFLPNEQSPPRPRDVPLPPPIPTRKPHTVSTPEREPNELANSPLFKKQFQKLGDERFPLNKSVDIQIYDV